jgi:hypothetical protein
VLYLTEQRQTGFCDGDESSDVAVGRHEEGSIVDTRQYRIVHKAVSEQAER